MASDVPPSEQQRCARRCASLWDAPATARPATAPVSSIITATEVGSMPRRTYSMKGRPACSAPARTARTATTSDALSSTRDSPSTAWRW